ncbi:probable cytochrome P450 9f2 [Uranotaenia lowii]|uniref:probable cytochrome P450 9f2 n=1 Tax=Uranotaenia lowii TaxID=190385 RepID=UPI00247A2734|nr:probable cytochrome P450 9f2 [Uranotaenia lowii]
MSLLMWFVTILVIAVFWFYFWSVKTYSYFKKLKVPYVKPIPLLGSLGPVFSGKLHPADALALGYKKFPDRRFSGYFEFHRPAILLHDPRLVKQIAVQDYDQFLDHGTLCPVEVDPFVGRITFFMSGQSWKRERKAQSPLFTVSKMGRMLTLVSEHLHKATERLIDDSKATIMDLDAHDLIGRLTNDVMTSVSLGVEVDSWRDRENDFYAQSLHLTSNIGFQGLKFFLLTVFPARLFTLFGIRIVPDDCVNFYRGVVRKVVELYRKSSFDRPDFISYIMKLSQIDSNQDDMDPEIDSSTHGNTQSDLDVAATVGTYIFAGIETSTAAVCFTLYELALNKNVQSKLHSEIDAIFKELDGVPITYEALQGMRYLDLVVSESLRKWPPVAMTNRACRSSYPLEDFDGTRITLSEGQVVTIPIFAFHRDPNLFPNPDHFNPERFADDNEHLMDRDAYMPFGMGPRNCIGLRLGLLQTKCAIYYLMLRFGIELSDKMEQPLKLKTSTTIFTAEKGFWFNLKPRAK